MFGEDAPRRLRVGGARGLEIAPDASNDFDTLAKDVTGEEVDDSDNEDYDHEKEKKKRERRRRGEEDDEEKKEKAPYMFFDFRRGNKDMLKFVMIILLL